MKRNKSFKKFIVSIIVGLTLALGITSASFAAFDPAVSTQGNLIIEEAGTYVLTGSMHGSVYITAGAGDVFLILDNAIIDGGETSAIIMESGSSLNIETKAGTVNMLSGMGLDDDYKAAIFSNANIYFRGEGTLIINGMDRMGIRTQNANINFFSGEYRIISGMDGILADGANNQVNYNGGTVIINDEVIFTSGAITANPTAAADTTMQNDAAQTASYDYQGEGQEAASFSGESFDGEAYGQEAPDFSDASYGQEAPDFSGESFDGEAYGQEAPDFSNGSYDQTAPDFSNSSNSYNNSGSSNTSYGTPPDMNWGSTTQDFYSDIESTDTAGEIVTSTAENTAASLEADYDNATYITMSDENSQVEISSSGTYVVTGSSSDGNIVVKKGTTGVVLVLDDLDLTSTTGATLSVNKNSEVKIIVSGDVTLTDAEDPADEESTDEEVADAFDGAAMKFKDGSSVYITGDGTLTLIGEAKNGIKAGDESVLTIDGEDLTVNIDAANDGINSNYDVNILDGTVNIAAEDDGVHADHILTIGNEDGTGPDLNITESTEGIEATVINVQGGDIDITSSDDAVNAANGDGIYEGVLDYSYNQTGGSVTINATGDGIDSNGNVNLIDGSAYITSSTAAGEAGIDYEGELYISDEFNLNNMYGTAGPDSMMGGNMGQQAWNNGNSNGQQGFGEMPF